MAKQDKTKKTKAMKDGKKKETGLTKKPLKKLKSTDKKPKKIEKKKILKTELKPFMDFLGVLNFKPIEVDYYIGKNKLYIIEADYLETFFIKIFDKNAYKYAASIEKHFITNAKNISKFTPNVNVAHDEDKNLSQFLFTDRKPGANKRWDKLNVDDKSAIVKEVGKLFYKIHTYNSTKTLKKEIYGKVDAPFKSWDEFLKSKIEEKVERMNDQGLKKSEILKFQKYSESKLISLSSHKISPNLLQGSISLNENHYLRSLLFLGNKISAVLNSEESIYGDKIWDLVMFHNQILEKNTSLEKDFFSAYGKLKDEEKERLEFYKEIIKQ